MDGGMSPKGGHMLPSRDPYPPLIWPFCVLGHGVNFYYCALLLLRIGLWAGKKISKFWNGMSAQRFMWGVKFGQPPCQPRS